MTEPSNENELIQKIVTAFSDAEFPENDHLVNNSYGEEPALVRHHFFGQNKWNSLSPEFMDFDGALSFFSDEAFRFFIPAFMIADINEQLNFNNPAVRLCWAVTPQSENNKIAEVFGGGTIGERAKACFEKFSEEERSAIVSYLKWKLVKDESDLIIAQALKHYWLKE
jgi:hypothetical protein